ncbi:MAG: hypothetical protein K6G22_00750 [Lachnospiraceae bacterium]|nr:hypothetical protein [Lachnospiraceae bacterium]
MKKALIMAGVILTVLITSMIVTSLVINTESQDMTAEMPSATLPVLYTAINSQKINITHGYTSEMDGSYLRGCITPLDEERGIRLVIDTFGTLVSTVGYEVRTMDMTRLIEDQIYEDYEYQGTQMHAYIHIKDLILPDTEYMLIVKLTLPGNITAKYYVRFIEKEDLNLPAKLDFVKDFSAKTFDKEAAADLKKYMESNSEGDNSSFGYVNIHSNFKQLTWGDLAPSVSCEKQLKLLDADELNACMELDYRVVAHDREYYVKEFFRIREGTDRMHLMEYERTMDQVTDKEAETLLVNGKIIHGIINSPVEYKENDEGNIFCFVQGNRLYSYNSSNNNFARIFSFWDEDNDDVRTRFDEHGIKILTMDESGNLTFLVYGYMNRGVHEGEEGIALYFYDSVINANEEQLFIPYKKSYSLLKHDIDALSYINYRGIFYLYLDGSVYQISMEDGSYKRLVDELDEIRFVSSADNSVIAWQPEENIYNYNSLRIMNLDRNEPVDIGSSPSEVLIPLGYMGHDFVFGKVMSTDISTDETGTLVLPMHSLCILSSSGELLKEYKEDGYYITDAEFIDNIINLKRKYRDEEGKLRDAEDDQIISNMETSGSKNRYRYVITDEMETTYQTEIYKSTSEEAVRITTPNEVLYEGDLSLVLNDEDTISRYYVYAKGEVDAIYTSEADAIKRAESIFGNVVDKKCSYIWQAGNRKEKTRIEEINEERLADETMSSRTICMDEMLKKAGVYKDTDLLTSQGNILSILKENIQDRTVLDLSGCSLKSVLYYVSIGSPVLAVVDDLNTVLIIGYDSKNTIIFNPVDGTIKKHGMNDSAAWFEANGNSFISYTVAAE